MEIEPEVDYYDIAQTDSEQSDEEDEVADVRVRVCVFARVPSLTPLIISKCFLRSLSCTISLHLVIVPYLLL
jgi:hypothetical protein